MLVIRPEPGCAATVGAAAALGLEALACPLSVVAPREWTPPPPATIDALLLGSANAVRHAGAALAAFADLPAYAVGRETARVATAAGLAVAAVGEGGLQQTLPLLAPDHRRLLRLCGDERVALVPPPGVTITEREVYAATPLALPPAVADRLREAALVLLHSGRAARHFAQECDRLAIARDRIALAAMAPRIARAAGDGWRAVRTAPAPTDAALLALAAEMWQGQDRMSVDLRQTW